eukprot:10913450-Lingulodinium_polyedra.AAC.1
MAAKFRVGVTLLKRHGWRAPVRPALLVWAKDDLNARPPYRKKGWPRTSAQNNQQRSPEDKRGGVEAQKQRRRNR